MLDPAVHFNHQQFTLNCSWLANIYHIYHQLSEVINMDPTATARCDSKLFYLGHPRWVLANCDKSKLKLHNSSWYSPAPPAMVLFGTQQQEPMTLSRGPRVSLQTFTLPVTWGCCRHHLELTNTGFLCNALPAHYDIMDLLRCPCFCFSTSIKPCIDCPLTVGLREGPLSTDSFGSPGMNMVETWNHGPKPKMNNNLFNWLLFGREHWSQGYP